MPYAAMSCFTSVGLVIHHDYYIGIDNPPVWIHQFNKCTSLERMALAHAMRLRPQRGIGWLQTGHWMRIHHASPCFTRCICSLVKHLPTSLCLANPCEIQTSSSVLNLFLASNHRESYQQSRFITAQPSKMPNCWWQQGKCNRKYMNIAFAVPNLKSNLSIIRHHDGNPQTNTLCTSKYTIDAYIENMHSAFIIYLIVFILGLIYHVNGIWRNKAQSRIICETTSDTVQDVSSLFPPVRRLSPPPQIEPLPQQSLMQVPCLRHKQVTHRPRQKGMGLLGSCFCWDDFVIQVIQVHFNHYHQLSAVHKTRLEGDMQF